MWGMQFGPGGPDAEDFKPEEVMRKLFTSIVSRGRDAWGYFYYDPAERGDDSHPQLNYFKSAGSATAAGASVEQTLPASSTLTTVVGHVRMATHGPSSNLNNDHPIIHRNIIGVHNGIISNYRSILDVTGRHDPDTQVDSEAIFASINKHGPSAGLAEIKGDMAVLFMDRRKPKLLRVGRGDERPLWMGRTRAGTVMFASEKRNLEATGVKFDTLREITDTNVLYTFKDGVLVGRDQFAPPAPPKRDWSKPTSTSYGYKSDKWGGKFLYANTFQLPDGSTLSSENYVMWAVNQELAARAKAASAPKDKAPELGDKLNAALATVPTPVKEPVTV